MSQPLHRSSPTAHHIWRHLYRQYQSGKRLSTSVNGHAPASSIPPFVSNASGGAGVVPDDDIIKLASQPLRQLTLADLVRHGAPPLPAASLLQSANFALSLLPVRLAHRLHALRNLPYIVVSNPHISHIYSNYLDSLSRLLPWSRRAGGITSLEQEAEFTHVLADLVQTHANTIPVLARGFAESRGYMSEAQVTAFLDEHLRARIGTRLIAEQHIALHSESHARAPSAGQDASAASTCVRSSQRPREEHKSPYIGVIHLSLNPCSLIRSCGDFVGDLCEFKYGVRPEIAIKAQPDEDKMSFAFIPVHLEYIMTELLKNAFRATAEAGMEASPVEVTVAAAPSVERAPEEYPQKEEEPSAAKHATENEQDDPSVDLSHPKSLGSSFPSSSSSSSSAAAAASSPALTIRIRDRGAGIRPDHLSRIWSYSFTTFSEHNLPGSTRPSGVATTTTATNIDGLNAISSAGGGSSIAGLGYGLPLCRAYAEYFGGTVALQSMYGWGTDVYLCLRGLGRGGL